MSAVRLRGQRRVPHRFLNVLSLDRRRRNVGFARRQPFLRRGRRADAARATVVTDVIDGRVVDHGLLVGVVDNVHVDVRDRRVVSKSAVGPAAAHVADADVAEAVVHATVEADVRAPIAGIEPIDTAGEAPVARRPQQADARRLDPRARHPEVAAPGVAPIARRPQVARLGQRRLHVLRQRRRRFSRSDLEADRDGRNRHRDARLHGATFHGCAEREGRGNQGCRQADGQNV